MKYDGYSGACPDDYHQNTYVRWKNVIAQHPPCCPTCDSLPGIGQWEYRTESGV